MPKRHPKGSARVAARTSATQAATLADGRMEYVRGEMLQVRLRLDEAASRFAAKRGGAADAPIKRVERDGLLREIRRKPGARPGAAIPERPAFIGDMQRTVNAVLQRQMRDSLVMASDAATEQAKAAGLSADIDKRRIMAESKRALKKRIDRYSKRIGDEMWQDIRRQTYRGIGSSPGTVQERLGARVKVYENRIRRVVRTETNRAYNEQMQRAMEQIEEQNPSVVMMKRWDATVDQRICVNCREMHGEIVPLRATFRRWGIAYPPLHPFCRCVITTWPQKRSRGDD